MNQFSRTELLIGEDGLAKLKNSKICIFGVGGVGGNCIESLARCGVGHFVLVDNDKVSLTNINRQVIASLDTIDQYKVDVMKERILTINKDAQVEVHKFFYLPSTSSFLDFNDYSYVIDAIDTVTAKIDIICKCKELNVPIISAMGCGNKLNPTDLKVGDIYSTSTDPLCKVMRRELKARGIKSLKVVYSTEQPLKVIKNSSYLEELSQSKKKSIPGSISFVPSVAGYIIASEVVKDLINKK